MNNDIEKIFKSSLSNNEVPYDPSAWEKMSARLDQVMPTASPKPSFKWGYGLVAGVVILGGIATGLYFLQADQTESKAKTATVQEAETTVKSTETSAKSDLNTAQAIPETSTEQVIYGTEKTTHKHTASHTEATQTLPAATHKNDVQTTTGRTTPPVNNENTGAGTPLKAESIVFPRVEDSYCENTRIILENQNAVAIVLMSDNGISYTIPANKSLAVDLSEAGNYYFTSAKQGKNTRENGFKVLTAPKSDFAADEEMLYEKGLPVYTLKSNVTAKQYKWTDKAGNILSTEKEANIHLFRKGQYDVNLTVTGSNGCSASTNKTIQAEVNYNLLAVTGFDPASSDPRKNTFMPYALSQRNIPFQMVIIDPKSGETVYQTKDINQPWDGVDVRTGQMVPANSTYIWKVTLQEHEKNESNAYKGTITRI